MKWKEDVFNGLTHFDGISTSSDLKTVYKKLGFEFLPDYIVTSEILSEKDFKNDENISKVISKQEALKDWNELLKSIKIMNYVLMSGAVFLSLIVLYNLGVLAISEMQIEFATMKGVFYVFGGAIGFARFWLSCFSS